MALFSHELRHERSITNTVVLYGNCGMSTELFNFGNTILPLKLVEKSQNLKDMLLEGLLL